MATWLERFLDSRQQVGSGSAVQARRSNSNHQRRQGRLHRPAVLRQHWLRRPVRLLLRLAAQSLKPIFPGLYATVAVPRPRNWWPRPTATAASEAEAFFLDGMTQAMHNLAEQAHPAFPVTIYYAFKQSRNQARRHSQHRLGNLSGGGDCKAGFALTGTWPMRTELGNRMIGSGHQRPRLQHRPRLPQTPADAPPFPAASSSAN
jgi:hypothetical protein